ncbi:cell wall-associated NlpC family hydrolase [Sphingopyxis panaciterrae]|uniref:C40 family peptidase n=1 Tax=Sphingopyxis panaciterrae TaxID=363841 RepID=UPI0031329BE8|nr:cell wall-associated NlpC family hydrolase [Sphingopyxis panaciterrae]
MTAKNGDNLAANRVRMGRPGVVGAGRDRFGLTGTSQTFDPRIVAIRPDLADISVAGQHFAPHYAAPMMRSGVLPAATLRATPSLAAEQTSELLFGEGFALLDLTGGWAWGYSLADHYVGYLAADALGAPIAPTHRVHAAEAILHSSPDAAAGGSAILPRGALVMGEADGEWLTTSHGFLPLAAMIEVSAQHDDPAAVAEELIGTPYVWGGRTAKGIDCSGLVQLAWSMAGVQLPRDSDLQLASLGADKDVAPSGLARGDLVFFPGHVGIMADDRVIIHASRQWMEVRTEPLADVIARSAAKGHEPAVSGIKRLR